MDGWMDGRMDVWMDGRKDGWWVKSIKTHTKAMITL